MTESGSDLDKTEQKAVHAQSDVAPVDVSQTITPQSYVKDSSRMPAIVAGTALAFLLIITYVGTKLMPTHSASEANSSDSSIAEQPSIPSQSSDEPSATQGNWQVSSESNPVTGVKTTVASLSSDAGGEQYIIVRHIGKKLECYIETNEFLETVDNMDSRISTVQYKFDEGKIIRQGWTISDDNTALFSPDNCAAFLSKVKKAKTLAFEFKPADKIPETITFSIQGFPDTFKF